jgi:hypothetical protein
VYRCVFDEFNVGSMKFDKFIIKSTHKIEGDVVEANREKLLISRMVFLISKRGRTSEANYA